MNLSRFVFNKVFPVLTTCCLTISGFIEGSVTSVLHQIEKRACEANSDTVLIVKNGKSIAAFGSLAPNQPLETYSITKSFVSLAIGLLIDEGKIESIDTPVYIYFPEWEQGIRRDVTIRDLMCHTSGMKNGEEMCAVKTCPDILKMALATDFISSPGSRFDYNNKATNLLAAIVEKASSLNVQTYLRQKLFIPMEITSDSWLCDTAGNQFGMSYLTMNAYDLAKIGVLIAEEGCWNGKRLISLNWITLMMGPEQEFTPFYSLLWWLDYESISFFWDKSLVDYYEDMGLSSHYVCSLRWLNGYSIPLKGQISYRNYVDLLADRLQFYFGSKQNVYNCFSEIDSLGLPVARWQNGVLRTVSARGIGGQQLIVMADAGLVAVRLSNSNSSSCNMPIDQFSDLECLLGNLAYEMALDPSDVEIFRCGKHEPDYLPPMYHFETDPEFQKPYYPGREECDKLRQEQLKCDEVIFHTDARTIPYYIPPQEEIKLNQPVQEFYQKPLNHVESHSKESLQAPSEEYHFGSLFEGAKPEVKSPVTPKSPSLNKTE